MRLLNKYLLLLSISALAISFVYLIGYDSLAMRSSINSIIKLQGITDWHDDMYLGHTFGWVHSVVYILTITIIKLLAGDVYTFAIMLFFLGSFFTMYAFAKRITNRRGAVLAGFIYLLAPFHILQTFFEGHQHLSFAYFLLPLGFLSVHENIFVGTLFLSLLLLSQPQQIVLAVPFIFLYAIANKKTIHFLKLFCFSLLISSFWWFPLFFYRDLFFWTKFSDKGWPGNLFAFLTLQPCASTYSGCYANTLPYPIAVLSLILFIIATFGFLRSKSVFGVIGLIAGILSMGTRIPGYDTLQSLPFFDSLRVPYRFLAITSISFAVLGAEWIKNYKNKWLAALIVLCLFAVDANMISQLNWVNTTDTLQYLKGLPDGKVFVLPAFPWTNKNKTPSIDEGYFNWIYEKKLVDGTVPSFTTKEFGEFLKKINDCKLNCKLDIFFDMLGAKYVYIDKSVKNVGCVDFDLKLLNSFGDTEIYLNEDAFPDAYEVDQNDWEYALSSNLDCNLRKVDLKEVDLKNRINSKNRVYLILTKTYYPFWVARVNGTKIYGKKVFGSLTGFELPAGEYKLKIEFEKPWQRGAGEIVSAFSFLALIGIGLKRCLQK